MQSLNVLESLIDLNDVLARDLGLNLLSVLFISTKKYCINKSEFDHFMCEIDDTWIFVNDDMKTKDVGDKF